jgi:hypothetical protein
MAFYKEFQKDRKKDRAARGSFEEEGSRYRPSAGGDAPRRSGKPVAGRRSETALPGSASRISAQSRKARRRRKGQPFIPRVGGPYSVPGRRRAGREKGNLPSGGREARFPPSPGKTSRGAQALWPPGTCP